eukprot:10949091-Alexandrium_andersonii.AAC.1
MPSSLLRRGMAWALPLGTSRAPKAPCATSFSAAIATRTRGSVRTAPPRPICVTSPASSARKDAA